MNHPATQPIHIAHIASGDLWAGAEAQLYTLCKYLNKMENFTVSVILLNHGALENKLREQNIYVEVLNESNLNALQIFSRLVKFLKRHKPDIVHTHRLKENILGSFAAKIAGNIPSLRTVHGAPEHRPSLYKLHKHFLYQLDWFSARCLQSKIISVSEELKTILAKSYPPKKIQVIENGVDIEALAPYRKAKISTDQPQHSYRVGLVGRLVPVKRVDLFIKIAKYLRDNQPEITIQFHIFGDGPLRTELEQLSTTLNVDNLIQFKGHCSDIHSQIAKLDALLITSDHEGLPMTLLEAMALGTPVVAHSVGGITAACQDGECCWLVKENRVENFAQALVKSLSETDLNSSRSSLAQSYIKQRYSANSNTTSLKSVYNSLIR